MDKSHSSQSGKGQYGNLPVDDPRQCAQALVQHGGAVWTPDQLTEFTTAYREAAQQSGAGQTIAGQTSRSSSSI